MAPKKRSRKTTMEELQKATEERIDAVTAEPLHEGKFIEVTSPDQSLKLYYNTETLIKIGTTMGGFMQPPHFREPMVESMVKRIEEIEGRRFQFGGSSRSLRDDAGYETEITHRHVLFEDIIDRFYLLSKADVFVCPACYQHYLLTVYIPECVRAGNTIRYIDDGATPVVDPLDVITHMLSPMVVGGETEGEGGEVIAVGDDYDTAAARIVFRSAVAWRKHCSRFHSLNTAASENRLRDILCTYHVCYNRLREEMFNRGEVPKRSVTLSQNRYWQLNAGYNRLRYNRIVESLEEAARHPETISDYLFKGQTIDYAADEKGDSDFIASDDDDDDDDEEREYIPHYSPPPGIDDVDDDAEVTQKRKRRRLESSSTTSSSETTSSSRSSSSSASSSSTSSEDSDVSSTLSGPSRQSPRRSRFGDIRDFVNITTKTTVDPRMTEEERRFYEKNVTDNSGVSRLYDPYMQQSFSALNSRIRGGNGGDVILGDQESEDSLWVYPEETSGKSKIESDKQTPVKLLLDDDDDDD